jgi:hypothetical protein
MKRQSASRSRTSRPACNASPHPALDRMRFLFTMSDIQRTKDRTTEDKSVQMPAFRPSFTPKRSFERFSETDKLHRKDRTKDAQRHGGFPRRNPNPFSLVRPPSSENGGARRDRTDDLMLAKHALSQLSYGPAGGRRSDIRRPTMPVVRLPPSVVSEPGGPGRT